MRFSKNASLNLSINAIVILILAITMLGLGLGFMKNLFGKTTGQLADVGEDIKNQMISELRRSNAKLTLDQEDITINTGSTREIYFGVKNVLSDPTTFDIELDCGNPLLTTAQGFDVSDILTFDKTRNLDNGEIDVQKMVITVRSTADATTYPCKLNLYDGASLYDSKSFFVSIQR